MYSLSERQIDFILEDLAARGIRMETLRLSLLDHVCAIIEQDLPDNGDFEKFYALTIATFYKEELSEIEDATLFLLNGKNNYAMKKLMIISGTFSVATFIGSSLCKILRLPLTDFLLFLAFVSFVFLFLPAMFLVRVKDTSTTRDRLILASGTISGILYFLCMLLTFLGTKWPPFLGTRWANEDMIWLVLWLTALGLALFVFLPAYFFKGISLPETRMNTIIISIFLVGFIGVQFRLTNLHPQKLRNSPISMQENGKVILASEPIAAVSGN